MSELDAYLAEVAKRTGCDCMECRERATLLTMLQRARAGLEAVKAEAFDTCSSRAEEALADLNRLAREAMEHE